MNNIIWKRTIGELDMNDINKVEKHWGVTLPDDYKQCCINNHRGRPNPCVYDFEYKTGALFSYLLSFKEDNSYYILKDYNNIKDRLVDNVYPFADDPGGNFICFDYREGKDKTPKVVYWDHELAYEDPATAIFYICDTFTELLSKLYESEECDREGK